MCKYAAYSREGIEELAVNREMLQINFILLELVYYFNRRDVEPKRQTFWVAEIILDYNISKRPKENNSDPSCPAP